MVIPFRKGSFRPALRAVRAPSVWFRTIASLPPQEEPAVRLICFPSEGASASSYAGWADQLPPGVEVLAVELPGRGTRQQEVPRRQLDPLLDQLAAALCHELSGPPFIFFGHRNGGFLAFALTQKLARRGLPVPAQLILSQTLPLVVPEPEARESTVRVRVSFSQIAREDALSPEELEALEENGSVPPGVLCDPELREEVVAPLEADLGLRARWLPDPTPVPTPIRVLVAEGTLLPQEREGQQETWSRRTAGSCEVVEVPGSLRYFEAQTRLFFEAIEDALDVRDSSGVRRFPRR